jgi:hypothetical protein
MDDDQDIIDRHEAMMRTAGLTGDELEREMAHFTKLLRGKKVYWIVGAMVLGGIVIAGLALGGIVAGLLYGMKALIL